MNLLGMRIGRGGDTSPPPPDEIQQQRILSARANRRWTELQPSALVRRSQFLVHADDDSVYTPYAGAVWNPLGGIVHSEMSPLFFTVHEGHVRLYEKYPRTWSEITASRAGAR